MKRETLVELGLEPEQIKTIMAEHGKSVTTLKKEISDYQNEISSLKNEYGSLKEKLEENNLKAQKDFLIRQNLKEINSFDDSLVESLLDRNKITIENYEVKGLQEQIDALKQEKPFLFKPEKAQTRKSGYSPAKGATTEEKSDKAFSNISEKYKK